MRFKIEEVPTENEKDNKPMDEKSLVEIEPAVGNNKFIRKRPSVIEIDFKKRLTIKIPNKK